MALLNGENIRQTLLFIQLTFDIADEYHKW